MAIPQPAVPLTDVCTVLFNNTLYTYSSSAFQSLELAPGAVWKELPSGQSVTGGVCVGSTPKDSSQAGLYVIGGQTTDATYTGLQKFTYSTGQWTTLTPSSLDTQSRLYHGAVYVNDTDTIVMYGGTQDGSKAATSSTFMISASAPYNVQSRPSTAPPTINPILLPWSSTEAVMIGGSASNVAVMLFSTATTNWSDSGATLATPFTKDTSSVKAALVVGDDNSKNLFTLDASLSPNQVARILLVDGDGQPITNSAPDKRSVFWERDDRAAAAGSARRSAGTSVTASNWPAYNASLAPMTTRSGYGMASNAGGSKIVIAGGASGSDVLCVFDGRANTWQNATQLFVQKKKNAIIQSSTSSASATSSPTTLVVAHSSTAAATTSSASPSPTAISPPSSSASHALATTTIVAVALGAAAALGFFALILYFVIRQRRKRRLFGDASHRQRSSGTSSSEKDAFAVTNASFAQRPNGSGKSTFRGGHVAQDSAGSFSSVAILMGRVNQPRPSPTIQRNNSKDTHRSSTSSLFNKAFKSTISKPIPQATTEQSFAAAAIPQQAQFERGGAPNAYGRSAAHLGGSNTAASGNQVARQGSARRSSGWNRYWSGGSTLNILGFGSSSNSSNNNNHGNSGGRASANNNNQSMHYSKRGTLASEVSSTYSTDQHRITQDSATVPPLDIPMVPDAKPRFQRVNSGSPTMAGFDNYIKDGMKGTIERPSSRASSHSGYSSGIPASVHDTWDPTAMSDRPWGSDRAPTGAYTAAGGAYKAPLAPASSAIVSAAPAGGEGKRAYVPTGMSRQPQLAMANTSSDMSWLNLGDLSRSRV